jgi:hypothetical protein
MTSLRLRSFAIAVLTLGTATIPSSVDAQVRPAEPRDSSAIRRPEISMTATTARVDSLAAGPRITRAGVNAPSAVLPRVVPLQSSDAHLGAGRNVALMGVGIAGVVIGSMVGGDGGTMIAIGGGVVGLVGLFRYLR